MLYTNYIYVKIYLKIKKKCKDSKSANSLLIIEILSAIICWASVKPLFIYHLHSSQQLGKADIIIFILLMRKIKFWEMK